MVLVYVHYNIIIVCILYMLYKFGVNYILVSLVYLEAGLKKKKNGCRFDIFHNIYIYIYFIALS